ncbi:hypothetical protein DPPLL_38340 [Desulfofustis limnaeus]|uniref:Uncharacterized protein n=1 Tax=Desulfofustis limnaeus TaxID=2740163 RepID=A0ABM7WEN5_9BACT|nr:hypothetical protein DPPLL_38340 [Desulfofustis limnaeus]
MLHEMMVGDERNRMEHRLTRADAWQSACESRGGVQKGNDVIGNCIHYQSEVASKNCRHGIPEEE